MYFARTILALLIIGAIGLVGYQIGVSQAVATQVPQVAGAVPPAYWYGPGWFGAGFFSFIFTLFFLFMLFGLMRAAFGGGRGWGHEGHRWSGRDRIEQIHRELHGEKPASGPSGTQT